MSLFVLFLLLLTVFGTMDAIAWRSDEETMSEYLVKKAKDSRMWAWTILVVIISAALILTYHFELIQILLK